jgi:hypothetical protein
MEAQEKNVSAQMPVLHLMVNFLPRTGCLSSPDLMGKELRRSPEASGCGEEMYRAGLLHKHLTVLQKNDP